MYRFNASTTTAVTVVPSARAFDGDVTTDPEVAAAAAALATLARHDATDCAEALGLTAYVGWSRHAGQRAHMVERGPSVPTSPVSRTRVFLRSGTVRAVKVG